jgi:hypothetical protein
MLSLDILLFMDLELFAVDVVLGIGEDEAQGTALVDVYTAVGLFRQLVMLSRELVTLSSQERWWIRVVWEVEVEELEAETPVSAKKTAVSYRKTLADVSSPL